MLPLDEAPILVQYLIARPASAELLLRYQRACQHHQLSNMAKDKQDLVMRLGLRFPALLGPLDAGAAWLYPAHPLRQKLLLLTALLETSPENADLYLPISFGANRWLLQGFRLTLLSFRSAFIVVLGIPLFFIATKMATHD